MPQAKASNETQKRANDSKSDGMQRSGADALGGVINKVHTTFAQGLLSSEVRNCSCSVTCALMNNAVQLTQWLWRQQCRE